MFRGIKTICDVVDRGQCVGCGACYAACSGNGVTLVNIESIGIRPRFDREQCAACPGCLDVCPGHQIDAALAGGAAPERSPPEHELGPVLEILEGHAADPEVRFDASSGGLLTALALYSIEREGMESVVHTGMDPQRPWMNRTVVSRSRAELLRRAGSRYAPAAPCQGLADVERSSRQSVFIGKPCDTAGAFLARNRSPALDANLGVVLAFFCAGTPSTAGTLDLARSFAITADQVASVRYRGKGWPGEFRVDAAAGDRTGVLSYQDSWGRLTGYRPFRCNLCPDGTGWVADVSCGDAWHRYAEASDDPGRSIVLVRTERGRRIVHGAMEAGYVILEPSDAAAVLGAQENLLKRRKEVFGRLLAMRLCGMPAPRFVGFSLFRDWIRLPLMRQAGSVLGTVRRIVRRRLWRRQRMHDCEGHVLGEVDRGEGFDGPSGTDRSGRDARS